jgi:hypothetical protein
MATLALAFGVDARELFPGLDQGATRAEALVQHMKQRGKGPGQILQSTENAFSYKFLLLFLKMVFDYQDDAQDRQMAEIRKIRSDARAQDMNSGVLTDRVEREVMLVDGDIDQGQFDQLELSDGRMPDGESVLTLFYYPDKPDVLKFQGIQDPLNLDENEPVAMINMIEENKRKVAKRLAQASNHLQRWPLLQADKALDSLMELYNPPMLEQPPEQPPKPGTPKPKTETRVRTRPATVANPKNESDNTKLVEADVQAAARQAS